MPQLKWDETDWIECLEVIPTVEDYEVSHLFEVKKDGLILQLGVWQYDGVVDFTLMRENVEIPVVQSAFFISGEVCYCKYKKLELLEFYNCSPVLSHVNLNCAQEVIERTPERGRLNIYLAVKPHI